VRVEIGMVAAGTPEEGPCPHCGQRRTTTDMVALTAAGTLIIGAMTNCDSCADETWHCAFCLATLPLDGAAVHRHIARRHTR
jgi:hypothetical protein